MTRTRLTLLTSAMLLSLVSSVSAFDISGTWEGTRKCNDLSAGAKLKFSEPFTAKITQVGRVIGIRFDFGFAIQTYTGLANFLVAKPDKGEFAMVHCGTDDVVGNPGTFDAIGRMQANAKPDKIKAKIKGTTFFSDESAALPTLGTCKWTATRTSDVDLGLTTTCPIIEPH